MAINDAPEPGRGLAAFVRPDASEGDTRPQVESAVARIGQGPQNDIVLDDDTVSTNHARLEYLAGGWSLTDLESKNGTFVNGVRLAPGVPTPLPGNAEVSFGAHRLIFLPDPDADPDAVAAADTPTEKTPLAERTAFRLPLWLLVLIILVVAILVTLLVVFGGDPQTVEPVTDPVTALRFEQHSLVAA